MDETIEIGADQDALGDVERPGARRDAAQRSLHDAMVALHLPRAFGALAPRLGRMRRTALIAEFARDRIVDCAGDRRRLHARLGARAGGAGAAGRVGLRRGHGP